MGAWWVPCCLHTSHAFIVMHFPCWTSSELHTNMCGLRTHILPMPHLHGGVVRSLASVIGRPLLNVLHRQVDAEHATCLSWGVAVCGEGNLCPGSRQLTSAFVFLGRTI